MQNVPSNSKHKFRESQFNILVLQLITAAIFIVFAVSLRFFGGSLYIKISEVYHDHLDRETSVSEVLQKSSDEIEDGEEPVPDDAESDTGNENSPEIQNPENSTPENNASDTSPVIPTAAPADSDPLEDENIGTVYDFSSIKTGLSDTSVVNNFIWPVSGKISSIYGYRTNPVTGIYCMHGGTDIAADTGTRVKAALDGEVYSVGVSRTYGNYIIIKHSDNLMTVYAHCSRIIAKEGSSVKQGEVIALVGSTGQSTGPHLHFEIRIGGCRVNPQWFLKDMNDL